MRIVTVIQTRTGSTRFPRKVLMPLGGAPLFLEMTRRVGRASCAGTVVVATTSLKEDDVIERICRDEGIECFRGNALDLLDRHHRAGEAYGADAVAKIPSDCPLIDPAVIDSVIGFYITHAAHFDYVGNLRPPTHPDGNDVEVMSMDALARAWRHADRDFQREHTTPYIWDNPGLFRLGNVRWETGLDYSGTHRWVLDYPEDYLLIREVYEGLHNQNPFFGIGDILAFLERRPDVMALNESYRGINWYRNFFSQIKTLREEVAGAYGGC